MNNKWKQAAVLLAVTTALCGQQIGLVHAQGAAAAVTFSSMKDQSPSTYSSNISDHTPGYVIRFMTEPRILSGVDASAEYYYSVPRATIGSNNYIELSISHSNLLIANQSTLTISVDDKPITSVFLTKETSQQGKIRIPLGAAETTLGFHKITIAKHSVVSGDLCSDPSNAVNWVKLEKASFAFLDTQASWTSTNLMKEFPHPFVEPGTPTEIYSSIVVPDSASPDNISSAMQVATFLSSTTAAHRFVPIVTESEWQKKGASEHAIAIGHAKDWRGTLQKLIQDNGISPKPQEVSLDYFQMRSNLTPSAKLLLLVTAGSEKPLSQSVRLLTDPSLKKQLTGSHLKLADQLSEPTSQPQPRTLTLSSFGYNHVLLDQVNSQSNQIVMKLPAHWKITGDGSLDLRLKVSPLVMQDETDAGKNNQLTVTVNGIPSTIALRQLKAESTGSDWYSVSIPIDTSQLKDAGGVLTIAFTASLNGKASGCTPQSNNGRWVFVDKESTWNMPHEAGEEKTFQNWPAPFVSDDGLTDTAFLLPEHVNGAYMSQLSQIVTNMVAQTGNRSNIPVFKEPLQERDEQALAAYNVIVLGDAGLHLTLQKNKGQLLVNKLKQLANLTVLDETTRFVTWIQQSAWNSKKTMAIFEANDQADRDQGSVVHPSLLTYLASAKEDGQLVVMSKSNEVFTVRMDDRATGSKEIMGLSIADIPIWVLIVIPSVFLLLLVIYIRMLKNEKKKAMRKRE